MRRIQGQTISSETVEIDDTIFVDCTLKDCFLEYSSDPVGFERTQMRGRGWVFLGLARGTVQFLQNTDLMTYDPAQWGNFRGQVH